MTLLPMQALRPAAHKLASLQSYAWLPPALLLLALSSVFLFSGDRGYFYREHKHNEMSAKNLAIAENLSINQHLLMFTHQTLNAEGNTAYQPYNRFPIGIYALIKLAILPFGDDLSAKIYAARMLMLLFFTAAVVMAYLSLRRLTASRWIALTAALLAFSSLYCLYYNDLISGEVAVDLFAALLVFHGMAVFEQEGRFRQLLLKTCLALLLGWHVYALLLPFIAFGLMRDLFKTRSYASTPLPPPSVLCRLKRATLSLIRSRYLTVGVVALLFGVSMLTLNFTNEYFALNREIPLTELPSFKSMTNRIGVGPYFKEQDAEYLSWPAFTERQFYRVGIMTLPYAFFLSVESRVPPRLFVGLGIAVSGASLLGLLFICRYKILLASLALSGFCWALPMRHNVAHPSQNFESVFYIGVTLTLFCLALMYIRRLSHERLVASLSVAASLIFVFSALRMAQLNNAAQPPELYKAVTADFQSIRNLTQDGGNAIFTRKKLVTRLKNRVFGYYLTGRIQLSEEEIVQTTRAPDFIVTDERAEGITPLTPNNRLFLLYKWEDYHSHLDEVLKESEPLIRSDFDVHLNNNTLLYVKDDCREEDISQKFFLALYPADETALPVERSQHGFHNFDFRFEDQAVRRGARCIAITPLPDYDIARIYTGQYIQLTDGSTQHLWEGDARLTETAH